MPRLLLRAFTLTELIVVVAIMLLLGAVVLAGGGVQRGTTKLLNEVYEVAALVRLAQGYGIGTKGVDGSFSHGFGVVFTPASREIVLFADKNGDQWYDKGDTVLQRHSLASGVVAEVCGATNTEVCASSHPDQMKQLVVLFYRPNPEAILLGKEGGSRYAIGKVRFALPGEAASVQLEIYLTGALAVTRL